MAATNKKLEAANDLVVNGVGVCLALPEDKKQTPLVFVAYMTGNKCSDVHFVPMAFPNKKPYTAAEIFAAIGQAEQVRNVTYTDPLGRPKDIFICRHNSGRIVDIALRNEEKNCFADGLAEILSSGVKFAVTLPEKPAFKPNKAAEIEVASTVERKYYTKDSYEYAIVNAYNACLLAGVLDSEEFQFETKNRRRVKFEFRKPHVSFVDDTVLYIEPIFRETDEFVEHYVTEEFGFVNGEEIAYRAYKIQFSPRLNHYQVARIQK